MSVRNQDRPARKRKAGSRSPLVLVFGESENDTHSVRELIEALQPGLAGRVQPRRQPLVLIKNARPEDVPDRTQQIARTVDIARSTHDVACVFAHEDCDDYEPKHEEVCRKIGPPALDVGSRGGGSSRDRQPNHLGNHRSGRGFNRSDH